MGRSVRPLRDEAPAAFAQLSRRVEVQERIPSGLNTIGPSHLAVVPSARIDKTTQTITNNTTTTLTWDIEFYDTASIFDTGANTRLTIPMTGIYIVILTINWAINAVGFRGSSIRKNGSSIIVQNQVASTTPAASACIHTVTGIEQFTAGDYIEGRGIQTSGGDLAAQGGSFLATWLGNH